MTQDVPPPPDDTGTPSLAVDGPVATLSLNRPEVANRLNADDLATILAHLQTLDASGAQVLVVRSSGRHFCSGYDIGRIGSDRKGPGFEEVVNALEDCRPVTIAAIQGGVFGGGTDLALACDFRVGTGACEMFMPAARLGLHFYRRGLERYVTRLGLDTAKRLFLTAERIDADEMRRCGFLTDLVAADALDARVAQLADAVAAMAPLAVTGMKKHLNRIARGALDADDLKADILRAARSDDLREGALAWKEKRKPVFRGR